MNFKLSMNQLIREIRLTPKIKKHNFFLDGYRIEFFSSSLSDIEYLINFLHDSPQVYKMDGCCYVYVTEMEMTKKKIFIDMVDTNTDVVIQNHIASFHFCHVLYDVLGKKVNIYYNEDMTYFILVSENSYLIYCDKACDKRKSLSLYIIREVLYREYENEGFVCFHAATCKLDEQGIMIIGESGSGKTGLLMSLLEKRRASYISNDRVLVNKELSMFTLPMPIRISPATVVNSSVLHSYVLRNKDDLCRQQNVDKLNNYNIQERENKFKVELSPYEIGKCFSVQCIDYSKLNVIIIPTFSAEHCKSIEVHEIDKTELSNILQANCYTPNDPLWIEPWFYRKKICESYVNQFISNIIDLLPAYKVKYGPDVLDRLM